MLTLALGMYGEAVSGEVGERVGHVGIVLHAVTQIVSHRLGILAAASMHGCIRKTKSDAMRLAYAGRFYLGAPCRKEGGYWLRSERDGL